MNRFIVSIILLLIIITTTAVNSLMLNSRLVPIISMLEQSQKEAEDGDLNNSGVLFSMAKTQWEKSSKYVQSVVLHSNAYDINVAFERTKGYLTELDKTEYSVENSALIRMLNHVLETQKINIENIM